ncbi:MAG: alanine--tRNA ligase, partial [Candidatus Hydrogenedentota bacterium]
MTTDEIRASFLNFFEERDHTVERSDLIVPANDPTLMFTSAGMVQFKDFYTGDVPLPYRTATTSQKCLRAGGKANDLDEVGKTTRHMTFFEMLGNFSFGDYFKLEAIQYAWEFSTQVMGIPAESIWISVFEDDDETWDIWSKEMGIPESRLIRMGAKDNFWGPAGDTGACGPCTELHFDKGVDIDPNADPENDPNERFMEFWNLVFPQFDHQLDGSRPALKNRGIDTGMGLERLAALVQKKETVFDIDGIFPIIEATQSLTKVKYTENPVPFRVIADHVRALSFLIADGVLPSNEGRGYVERRLLRRASRFGRELGLEKPFLCEVSKTVVDLMGHQFPELLEKQVQIEKIIQTEEERFAGTLARGMEKLDELAPMNEAVKKMLADAAPASEAIKKMLADAAPASEAIKRMLAESAPASEAIKKMLADAAPTSEAIQEINKSLQAINPPISGEQLFKLHDTYGFPLDLASDIAEDRGYAVDVEGFNAAMAGQRDKARSAWTGSGEQTLSPIYRTLKEKLDNTEFLGYEQTEADAMILAIIKDGESLEVLSEGEEAEIILDRTPFYAESGGQVGDTGVLDGVNGSAHVNTTKAPIKKQTVHYVTCNAGVLKPGDKISAQVAKSKRTSILNHHTATHLLQAALQNVLGDHVHQAGSMVSPDRLRFDFTHFEGIDSERLRDIERLVNQYVRTNTPVTIEEQSLEDARAAGAMALFGEKYEDVVRVVSVGDISMELCGGTHVSATGVIGYFKIISESSIASGVRRIEAVCGESAVDTLQEHDTTLSSTAHLLGSSMDDLYKRVQSLVDENRSLSRHVQKWKQAAATGSSVDYLANALDIKGIKLAATEVSDQDAAGLRMIMDSLRDKIGSGVIVLASASDGKVALCVGVTKDLTST